MEKIEYPPYACSCCGIANGDMFWDYVEHNADNLTYKQVLELCDGFDESRANWHECNKDASKSVRYGQKRKKYAKKSPYWEQRKTTASS